MDGIPVATALRMHWSWAATAWRGLREKTSLANSSITDHAHCFRACISEAAPTTKPTSSTPTRNPRRAPLGLQKMGLPAGWLSGFEPRERPGLFFVTRAHSSPGRAHSLDFAGANDISLRAEGRSSLARGE